MSLRRIRLGSRRITMVNPHNPTGMHQRGRNHLGNVRNNRTDRHGGYDDPYQNQQYGGVNHEVNVLPLPPLPTTLQQHGGMVEAENVIVGTPDQNYNFVRTPNGGNDVNVNENFSK